MEKKAIFIDDHTKTIYYSNHDFECAHLSGAFWIPCLNKYDFDGHIYISGATNSGKSYIIKKIIQNDLKKRNVILFTDLKNKDPSLNGIEYVKYEEDGKFNDIWLNKHEKNKIMVFDDVQFNEKILIYRDTMLEKGRHLNTIVICVNHKLRDHYQTKVPLNEARFVVTFPCSNRGAVFKYLKDEMEMDKKKLNEILDIACKEGRHLVLHKHHPVCIATTESVFKL